MIIRIATIIGNIASQIYYPLEHIAWLADKQIINIKSDKFWLINLLLWIVSSLTAIIRLNITLK
jgi:peroxin-11C